VLPGGLTAHPAWAQWGEIDPIDNDLAKRFEITTQDPQLVQNNLGYLITVKGKRVRVGGGSSNGPTGEIVEEDWGSSFTGQALESFDPSTQETVDGQKKTILGSGTVTIKGIASAGQKVDLTYYPFSYTITVQRAGDQPTTVVNSGTRSTPIIHDSLGNWNVDELNGDGTRKYPAGEYTVTLAVTPSGQGGEGGTVTTNVTVTDPQVTFTGLARACAGGIAVDGVHDFTITATAKEPDGTPVANNTEFKLSFKNNRGHDYSSDDPGIKPDGWTAAQIKKAKFVTVAGGVQSLVEELVVHTNENGQFPVTVLSSDIVSQDIEIQVTRTNQNGQGTVVGSQNCRFDQAAYRRRFANPFNSAERYPEDDYGWLFQQKWLSSNNSTTTAKLYLKFMRDPNGQDADGNWDFVTGHKIMFEIASIEDQEGNTVTATNDYVVFESTGTADAFATTVPSDGAATVTLKAASKIAKVKIIHIAAYDESVWSD
jgi:hypothetical protein